MSRENAQQFLAEMQKNESQFEKLASMDGATVTKMAQDKGFGCSVDELKAVLTEARKGALSEKDLAGVAGGAMQYALNGGLVGRIFPDNLSDLWSSTPGGGANTDRAGFGTHSGDGGGGTHSGGGGGTHSGGGGGTNAP